MELPYTYEDCVNKSIQVRWELDDVFPTESELDFSLPFLPQSLAPTDLDFLSSTQRLMLNQIAGNAYLNIFQFVEEYILAVMVQHANAELFGDPQALRALTRFVDEELKHQLLFQRFRRAFDRGFGEEAGVLENATEIAGVIMGHSPMAVMLITLHIEWMTQRHYTECVKDEGGVDPLFKSLLHHHWLEESQHARIDMLEFAKISKFATAPMRQKAVEEYSGILDAFDGLLAAQADLDVESFVKRSGETLTATQREQVRAMQLSGYRKTLIWFGATHPKVVEVVSELDADGGAAVLAKVDAFA